MRHPDPRGFRAGCTKKFIELPTLGSLGNLPMILASCWNHSRCGPRDDRGRRVGSAVVRKLPSRGSVASTAANEALRGDRTRGIAQAERRESERGRVGQPSEPEADAVEVMPSPSVSGPVPVGSPVVVPSVIDSSIRSSA